MYYKVELGNRIYNPKGFKTQFYLGDITDPTDQDTLTNLLKTYDYVSIESATTNIWGFYETPINFNTFINTTIPAYGNLVLAYSALLANIDTFMTSY